MSMKLLEDQSITDALSALVKAQERSERSLSFTDISGYEGGVIGTCIGGIVGQIDACVREISGLIGVLRDSADPVPPEEPDASDTEGQKVFAEEAERYWRERMKLVHAVERCSLRVDAARAAGDVSFMDGIMEVRDTGLPPEEQAALTDVFLTLKDVYDAAAEAAEALRLRIARGGFEAGEADGRGSSGDH